MPITSARSSAAEPGPALIHTHFTAYDVPAVLAAPQQRRRRSSTGTSTRCSAPGPLSVARHSAKFALFRRYVDRILVPAANIGEGLVAADGARATRSC